MQKRGAKKINLQSSVDQKFRSPLCNVSSHAQLWVHLIFKTCLRFHCDLYVCKVKLGMLTNLPYLGNHQYACHTAESDYRTNRFGIPLNRRRMLFFVRPPTDSTSERKNCRCLAKLPSLSKLNHSPSSCEKQTLSDQHWTLRNKPSRMNPTRRRNLVWNVHVGMLFKFVYSNFYTLCLAIQTYELVHVKISSATLLFHEIKSPTSLAIVAGVEKQQP